MIRLSRALTLGVAAVLCLSGTAVPASAASTGTITATFVDEGKRPVVGLVVETVSQDGWRSVDRGTTSAAGAVTLDQPVSGRFVLRATDAGGDLLTTFVGSHGRTSYSLLTSPLGYSARSTTIASGTHVLAATPRLVVDVTGVTADDGYLTVADERGVVKNVGARCAAPTCSVSWALQPARYRVQYTSSLSAGASTTVQLQPSATRSLTLASGDEPAASVAGTVRLDGAPYLGLVGLRRDDGRTVQTSTDAAGRYGRDLPPGHWTASLPDLTSSATGTTGEVTVAPGVTATLDLNPRSKPAALRGDLVVPFSGSVNGASLVQRNRLVRSGAVDASSRRVRFGAVAPGTYRLYLWSSSRHLFFAQDVTMPAGKDYTTRTKSLTRGMKRVTLSVPHPKGATLRLTTPAMGTRHVALSSSGVASRWVVPTASALAALSYRDGLDDQEAAAWLGRTTSFDATRTRTVTVRDGGAAAQVRLHVVNENGVPIKKFKVRAVKSSGERSAWAEGSDRGDALVHDLRAVPYRFEVVAEPADDLDGEYEHYWWPYRTVAPDTVVTARAGATVAATITVSIAGLP